ncbi:MAG: hypothetical protein ACJ73L_04890 [Actinomycetes bacterium]
MDKHSVMEVHCHGISTVWVGKLVARWRAGGWDAVEKQSTRPKSNPNAAPQTTIDAVLALRTQLIADGLDAGPHTLAAHLQRQGLPSLHMLACEQRNSLWSLRLLRCFHALR